MRRSTSVNHWLVLLNKYVCQVQGLQGLLPTEHRSCLAPASAKPLALYFLWGFFLFSFHFKIVLLWCYWAHLPLFNLLASQMINASPENAVTVTANGMKRGLYLPSLIFEKLLSVSERGVSKAHAMRPKHYSHSPAHDICHFALLIVPQW